MDNKQIGKNLERARLKVNLNKRQFAKIAGVDASQYGKAEKGEEGFSRENLLLIAEKHGVNAEFLSTGKGPILIDEIEKAGLRGSGSKGIEEVAELSQGQIISILAQALKDQAKAFADQAEMMKHIESKMAQESTQAMIDKKLDGIVSNLDDAKEVELLASKHLDSKFQEILDLLPKLGSHKKNPSRGADNKLGGNGGGVQKPRRKR